MIRNYIVVAFSAGGRVLRLRRQRLPDRRELARRRLHAMHVRRLGRRHRVVVCNDRAPARNWRRRTDTVYDRRLRSGRFGDDDVQRVRSADAGRLLSRLPR